MKKLNLNLSLNLSLLLFPCFLVAQKTSPELQERIRRVENSLNPGLVFGDSLPNYNLEQRMRETGIKGLSLAVISNYRIEWAKGYGWADEENKISVSPDTRFQAASISKSINSMGLLKLSEQGKLDPEADINLYLKSWQFPYDSLSRGKKISTNNLLSHTAGLDIHGFWGYKRTDSLPALLQIIKGEKPANSKPVKSLFEPGKMFKYSGGGTTISQLLLMDITGKSYAEWMKKNILRPLGMKNSSFRQPPADSWQLATGYLRSGKAIEGRYFIYPELAAAGLWTTPTDLARYIIDCQLTLKEDKGKILKKETMLKRMTPYIDKYSALGVIIQTKGTENWFNHNGGNQGFLCTSWGSMKDGKGVAIMINGEDFSVAGELLNSVAIVYGWKDFYKPEFRKTVRVPKDSLRRLCGTYQLMQDTIILQLCGENLCMKEAGEPGNGYQTYFTDPDTFIIREQPNILFRILRDGTGKMESIEMQQNRMKVKMKKISE